MQKKNLTDGIKAILADNGALFILLAISVSPQPFITAVLAAFSLAAVCLAVSGFAKRFKGKYLFVLSIAVSGTVFGLSSRLVSYPQRDFIFIMFSLSAVYLSFILSRKFTGNIEFLNIAGVLAAFIPAALTISAFAFIFKLSPPAGLLITAGAIILYRIIWRHIL